MIMTQGFPYKKETSGAKRHPLAFEPLPEYAKHLDLTPLHRVVAFTGRPMLFFDIESTTFVHAAGFGIIEIALLAINTEGNISVAETLLDVGLPIFYAVKELTGIHSRHLIGKPKFPEIADRLRGLFSKATVLGYYSKTFDLPGVHKECERFKVESIYAPFALDIRELVKPIGFQGSKKLTNLAKYLKIELEGNAHRAMYDTLLTAAVAAKMAEILGPQAFRDSQTTAFLGK